MDCKIEKWIGEEIEVRKGIYSKMRENWWSSNVLEVIQLKILANIPDNEKALYSFRIDSFFFQILRVLNKMLKDEKVELDKFRSFMSQDDLVRYDSEVVKQAALTLNQLEKKYEMINCVKNMLEYQHKKARNDKQR